MTVTNDMPTPGEKTNRIKNLGPLHDLLLLACPPNEKGVKNIETLAKHLEMSTWGVYKWIGNGSVPQNKVRRIVELSDGRTSLDDFIPFVFL